MADANPIQPYDYPPSEANDFKRKGHPGKWYKSITCTSGITNFTGSNFGVGGIVVSSGGTGTAYLSDGGEIPLGTFADSKSIIELSVKSVNVTAGTVYALIRNQIIR